MLLAGWVLAAVPDFAGQVPGPRPRLLRVATVPGVRPVLAVVMCWVLSHYLLYTYIAPFLAAAGMIDRLGVVLMLFGLCTLVGLWGVGLAVDRWMRALVLLSLGMFATVALVLGIAGSSTWVVMTCAVLWGLSFSGAPTLLQTALGDAAGDDADVAQSMLVTVFNLSFAGSGVLGGLLLETLGTTAFPWVLAVLVSIGWLIAFGARKHGFPTGRRQT